MLLGHVILGVKERGRAVDERAGCSHVRSKESKSAVEPLNLVSNDNRFFGWICDLNRARVELFGGKLGSSQIDDVYIEECLIVVEQKIKPRAPSWNADGFAFLRPINLHSDRKILGRRINSNVVLNIGLGKER